MSSISADTNKAVVRRYFSEAIDGRADVLDELFADDCVIHRRELPQPLHGVQQLRRFLEVARLSVRETRTTIHRLVGEGDFVCAHLAHRVLFAGMLNTPFGMRDVAGKTAEWTAMAMFRFTHARIAEEWVNRDELAILRQLGVVPLP